MKNNDETETNGIIQERLKFSISLNSQPNITIPEVLPRKRLSILLWHLPKTNSIHPLPIAEENSQGNKLNVKAQTKTKRFSMIDNSPLINKIQRENPLNNANENFNRTFTNINARMLDSRMGDSRMLYSLEPEDKPSYKDPELDFNYKDSEEKRMLYEQIRVIIQRDDNEDFYKVGLLMEEENEESNDLWNIDYAEEYQKEYDHFTHLQEDQQFLYCERKTPFDLIKTYADPYPCLECRKSLVYYSEKISFACKKIIKHPLFDNIVLLIIILNCLLLVFEDPTKTISGSEAYLEQVLLAFYSAEMTLKIIGLGFICNKNSYLRDIWNVLDFFIIITSYLPVIFTENDNTSSFKFSSLRTFRVLRPLRTISSVKSLRNLLVTLISSIPLLLDILLFFLFFLLTYSMVAVHLYSGSLKYRCFDQYTGKIVSQTQICGYDHCQIDSFCGKSLENPFYGMMNFDNIFFSLILCFQVVTLQSWTVVMFEIVAATSLYSVIFFITLVFFGTFFLLNLTLAVIKSKFTDTQKLKESLGKEVIKKVSEVQINELRLLKKMERSHYKRLKNQKKELGIGASEEGRPGSNKFDEITWEDLLQLKEMIREEKLREEEEERFQMMRRERIKSDEIDDEKKMIYYVRKVQNLKKNALRLFLKKEALFKTKRDFNAIQSKNFKNNHNNTNGNSKSNNYSIIHKKNKIVPLETAKNGTLNTIDGSLSQPTTIEIEDPSVFTNIEVNTKDLLSAKGLTLSYKDLKFDKKVMNLPPLMNPPRIETFQKRRNSIKTSKSLQTINKALSINYNESLCFQETIKEDIENEIDDQENQEKQEKNEKNEKTDKNLENNSSILINENHFAVLPIIDEKSSFESDLINDSDFNDSVTLNKAKLECIFQSQPKENLENLENPSKDEGEEENEGFETKNSDRPFMRELEKSTTAISQINDKPTQKNNDSNKTPGGALKRSATKRFNKGNNHINVHFAALKNKSKENLNKSKETIQKRPNIRDFNLMVDMDKQYIGYSADDVLENRIFELIEKKKREEELSIHNCRLPIELKPSTLKYQDKELLDQIKEKRKKILALKESNKIKKRRLPLKSPFANIISNALPTISLRRHYYPQKFLSFLKSSGNKSPKRGMLNKKKKNQLKLDDDLDFTYTSLQQKINENMIPKQNNSLNNEEFEEEYLEIHRKDRKIKKKSSHVWSGADVFPLKVIDGYWSMEHVNTIFKALSRSKQDKLIWLPSIYGKVRYFFVLFKIIDFLLNFFIKLRILHKYFERFLNGELFEKILLLIVVINTIIMCFDGLFTDQASIDLQSRFFFFFNIFFVVEMCIKLLIFGFKSHFSLCY